MGKTLKELMEERHPARKVPTEAEITQRLVDRVSKTPKDMVRGGLDALHPVMEKPTESAAVKLVRMKQKLGLGLSPKERIVVGWELLHPTKGTEDILPVKEETVTEPVVEPVVAPVTPVKTAMELANEVEAEWLKEHEHKEGN